MDEVKFDGYILEKFSCLRHIFAYKLMMRLDVLRTLKCWPKLAIEILLMQNTMI